MYYLSFTRSLWFFTLLILSAACSQGALEPEVEQQKTLPPPKELLADYLPLEVGHYWVFGGVVVDMESGTTQPIGKYDSLYVSRDTIIGQQRYFVLEGNRFGEFISLPMRPSGPELIDADGRLIFSLDYLEEFRPMQPSLLPPSVKNGEAALLKVPGIEVPYGYYPALVWDQYYELRANPTTYQEETSLLEVNYYGKGIGPIRFERTLPNLKRQIITELVRTNVE